MKYHIHILIILITLISIPCLAQTKPDPTATEAKENIRELGSLSGTGNVRTFDNRYEGTKGSPYVFEEWVPGEVLMLNEQRILIREMNYNCFDNEVAYLDPDSKAVMLINKYTINRFFLIPGQDTLLFVPLKLDEDRPAVFAEVLYQGESTLYKLYEKEFIRANYEGGYSADRKYDEFADKSSLYLSTANNPGPIKIKKSKKQILAALSGAADGLAGYVKAEKLDLKREEDLIRLLEYYDSL
jgi:hypothetical protein